MAGEAVMIRTDLLDIAFDGVIDKNALWVKAFYTEHWYNHSVHISELLNPPDFIKKWMEHTKQNIEAFEPESLFSLTISHKYNEDYFVCTVDFYRKPLKPANIIDYVVDECDDEMMFLDSYCNQVKRTYKYEISDEKSAQKLNNALKKHVQWFNDDCQNIYHTVCQMDLKTLANTIKELNLKIKETEDNFDSYIDKTKKAVTMLCETYKDIK